MCVCVRNPVIHAQLLCTAADDRRRHEQRLLRLGVVFGFGRGRWIQSLGSGSRLRAQRSGKHTNGNHNEVYQPSTRLPKKPKIGHTRIIGHGLETNIREMV